MEPFRVLKDLGFSEKEALVYLKLLEFDSATATVLADKTAIDRTLMYHIMRSLSEKGVVSQVIRENVRYFTPANPETLLAQVQEKEEQLKTVLPTLKALQNQRKPETRVEVYRGRAGTNTLLKMILRDGKPYFILGGAQEACSIFTLENTVFVRRAEELNLSGRILARKGDQFFVGRNEEYRFVPAEVITSTSMIMWASKTAIFVWSDPYYAILISNEHITKSNVTHFNFLWVGAEKPTRQDIRKKRANILPQ